MKVAAVLMVLVCISEALQDTHTDGSNIWVNAEASRSSLCAQPPGSNSNGKKNNTERVGFCFKSIDDVSHKFETNNNEGEPETKSKEDEDEEDSQEQTEDAESKEEADDSNSEDSDKEGCSSAPCQNGGTCLPNPNGFKCTCPNGIEGEYCEYDNAEIKVENINHELNLFDEDLKEDVKIAARMLAQKFDEKNPKMKLYLRSLLPRVLSSLMFPEGENKMEDILDDIFGYYGHEDAYYIKTTLYKLLKIVHEDRRHEKKHIIQTILKITGGIEYYDILQKLSEMIYFALK